MNPLTSIPFQVNLYDEYRNFNVSRETQTAGHFWALGAKIFINMVEYLINALTIEIPILEWYGWKQKELGFPDPWTVKNQKMSGHGAPALDQDEIRKKIRSPIGTNELRDLAKGKEKCCIIFDDATRPTKIYQMLPSVLNELHEGGLTRDQIIFVMATGAHAGRTLIDFQKKLGSDIPERYNVFNHNPYENLEYLGKTSYGTPVHINKEVMSCDLKVSVGAILPHFGYGFGGGSKMLLPGVAGIDWISPNHHIDKGTGPGEVDRNRRRLDSEEAARMAGLDFVVNAILNADCDVADIFSGDFLEAHRAGLDVAREHYSTNVVRKADVVVVNGYPMANEGYKSYHISLESIKMGGDLVFLLYTPEGCRVHYYNGRFGMDYGGRGWSPEVYIKEPLKMGRILCVSPQINRSDKLYYGKNSIWVKSWSKAMKMLRERHGEDALVAVYPTAAMQISKENTSKS